MAMEFQLSFSAHQVNERLKTVETNTQKIEQVYQKIDTIDEKLNDIDKNANNIDKIDETLDIVNNDISQIFKDIDKIKVNGADDHIADAIIESAKDSLVSLKNSAAREFKGLSICGKSYQNTYIGKNLFNKNISVEQMYDDGNGYRSINIFVGEGMTVTASVAKRYNAGEKGGYLFVTPNGDLNKENSLGLWNWLYHNETTGNCNISRTITSTDGYISFFFTLESFEKFKDELQVEIGEVKTDYEPYVGGEPSPSIAFPQEVTHIVADEEIDIFVRRKNLFNCYVVTAQDLKFIKTVLYNDYTNIDSIEYDGDIKVTFVGTPDTTGNTYKYLNGYFSVGLNGLEVGRTYTLIYDFEILKNPLQEYKQYCLINEANIFYTMEVKNQRAKCTFTLKEHYSNSKLTVIELRPCARDMIYKNFMILEGECDFEEYEPTQTQQITISAPAIGIPGFENFYDEIDLEKGKYVQRIGKYEFTGEGYYDDFIQDHYAITYKIAHLNETPLLCSHSPIGDDSTIWANENYIRFNINYWNVSTVEEFKTFLAEKYAAGDPVYIYYVLPEPIEIDLTEELIQEYKKLYTYYPITNIINNKKCKMNVKYIADTKNYIDERFALINTRISALETFLNNGE